MTDIPSRLAAALVDRYRIERELGEGGMATVYLADDLKHGRKVALKVLKSELAAVVGAERFLAEIKTTANLQHPNILPLFDSGEADGFLYFVMPYVAGETLQSLIGREQQLPVDEAIRIAKLVANALQAAHDQGVIHHPAAGSLSTHKVRWPRRVNSSVMAAPMMPAPMTMESKGFSLFTGSVSRSMDQLCPAPVNSTTLSLIPGRVLEQPVAPREEVGPGRSDRVSSRVAQADHLAP
jgi:hypothetical protein